jgi:hypothetical protein
MDTCRIRGSNRVGMHGMDFISSLLLRWRLSIEPPKISFTCGILSRQTMPTYSRSTDVATSSFKLQGRTNFPNPTVNRRWMRSTGWTNPKPCTMRKFESDVDVSVSIILHICNTTFTFKFAKFAVYNETGPGSSFEAASSMY